MSDLPFTLKRRSLVTAAGLVPLMPLAAMAQEAKEAKEAPAPKPAAPPLRDFFRQSSLRRAILSPDGRLLAGIREVNGRDNIVVVDLGRNKTTIITNFSDGDVASLSWINSTRLIFTVTDRERGGDQIAAPGLFAINADASQFVTLAERSFASEGKKLLPPGTSFLSRVAEKGRLTDDVVVVVGSYQALGKSSTTLHRVNTLTGRSTLLTVGAPARASGWLLDTSNVARVCVSYDNERYTMHYRDGEDRPWRAIYSYTEDDSGNEIVPVALDAKGQLYVTATAGNDTAGLYLFDIQAGQLNKEPVLAIKGFDIQADLVFDATRSRLLALRYEAIKSGTYWLDERWEAIQAKVDAALPGLVNHLAPAASSDDGAKAVALVYSYSDVEPGRYFLFREDQGLTSVGATRPWIQPDAMRPIQFYRYPARDGLQIPAQLTLPAGVEKPPLIVLHYGGPWVRPIGWHWDPVVQFLASRGYAVFMPAPRASTGFGNKLFRAGWKQWGLGMQDDVTDGVKQLIAQGKVDGRRVALVGASYGGYLTMMGLVKEPELFRCGVNWVGVTDPSFMFTVTWTDFNRFGAPDTNLRRLIGDPEKDAQQFRETSPLLRAAEIKQPVLMAYGAQDQRVPLINGEKMRAALAGHNKAVEWVVYPDEGHGWRREANQIDFWGRVETFLARNLA